LPKEALISSLPAGIELILGRNENHIVFTRVRSTCLCSFGGTLVNPLDITNVPPVFGKQILAIPWTTTEAFPSRFEFFHTFPLSKGGTGDFGGLFG